MSVIVNPNDKLIGLVDGNNFYVSCERVFRPDLIGKPVAVLSNNDGCLVSRSQEIKDLGIKMGVPAFQIQHLVKQHHIHLLSSNYSLYADLSARMMSVLETFTPTVEVYSIDEAFLDFTDVYACRQDPIAYAKQIKETVQRQVGIPVCVGLGPTKTLAKLANFAAKKWQQTGGVLNLSDQTRREKLMKIVPVDDVWGIGRQLSKQLNPLGIYTVWDLAQQSPQKMQQRFSVVMARTIMELNGISCLDLETIVPDKQQIVCSRSFSRKLTTLQELSPAMAEFACRASEKLRQQHSVTGCATAFLRTNPFAEHEPQYQRAASQKLHYPSQDSRIIAGIVQQLLKEIYRPGYSYQKCGVQLSQIQSHTAPEQLDLFDSQQTLESPQLMQTLDQINRRFPKGIAIATTKIDQTWKPKAENLSQRYTTDWRELVTVYCH
ncbi:Y-family DNA polymerase [Methylomonas methanica]|uniref:DNA-directed DNA polymerase n=1 Tax=Methylomonas methanica (strain DSM 25384 / MC09) TaxID=857087 RepID=G0A568_METMM|nr:Y-family DNA polymerase [Methylomonas methanica]AEG00398.1 DNA-directed DNA polymerase [Methylomonas methanica MC09]